MAEKDRVRPVTGVTYDAVVHELTADPAVVEAKMMGMPSLKLESKLFAGSSAERNARWRALRRRARKATAIAAIAADATATSAAMARALTR